MDFRIHLREYLTQALEIGKRVPYSEEIIEKLQNFLNEPSEEYFFSSLEGALYDEFGDTRIKMEEIRNPKKSFFQKVGFKKITVDVNELVPYATKMAYLMPIMLETIATSQKYHIDRGDKGICTPGEIIFVVKTWPTVLEEIKELKEAGAEFDIDLIMEIDNLYNRDTIDWLKEKWFKK